MTFVLCGATPPGGGVLVKRRFFFFSYDGRCRRSDGEFRHESRFARGMILQVWWFKVLVPVADFFQAGEGPTYRPDGTRPTAPYAPQKLAGAESTGPSRTSPRGRNYFRGGPHSGLRQRAIPCAAIAEKRKNARAEDTISHCPLPRPLDYGQFYGEGNVAGIGAALLDLPLQVVPLWVHLSAIREC